MDTPGISLFQGANSIRLNTSNPREEEDEFIAEEEKRKAELNNLFKNAFDDLIDGDDDDDDEDASTINTSQCSSSGGHIRQHVDSFGNDSDISYSNSISKRKEHIYNVPHFNENIHSNQILYNKQEKNHMQIANGNIYSDEDKNTKDCRQYPSPPEKESLVAYKQAGCNSIEQFEVLYGVRLREIERLNKQLEDERNSKEQILRKLTICETEKSGILSNNNHLNENLESCKAKIKDLEKEIVLLKDEIKMVEKSKADCQNDVELYKKKVMNLEQQIGVMQRCDGLLSKEKHYESIIESLKVKHKKELNILEQQYESALQKINEKEDLQLQLENKIEEIEKRHVATLLNKCDATVRQEATVKALLDQANLEKIELTKKINALESDCMMLRNDLDQYESVSRLRLFNTSSSDEQDNDSLRQHGSKRNDYKKSYQNVPGPQQLNRYSEDIIVKLKEELHRAITGQRSKRHEIKKLQVQIQNKELQINKMREQEKAYIIELDSLKKEVASVKEQLKQNTNNSIETQHTKILPLQMEIEKLKTERENHLEQINSLEGEIKILKDQLLKEELNKKKQGEEYLVFHDNEISKIRNEHENLFKQKELEWSKKMDEILNECDEVKQLYIEIRTSKDKLLKKLKDESLKSDKFIKENNELTNTVNQLQLEVKRLENHILDINKDKRELEAKLINIKNDDSVENEADKNQTSLYLTLNGEKINLQKMKEEVINAKQNYIELEKTLKSEYGERILKLQTENSNLKEALKEKERRLSDLKKDDNYIKVDAVTNTENIPDIGFINEKHVEEIKQLEKEVEKLKDIEIKKSQEMLQLEFEYQKRLQCELEELEMKLSTKHQEEIALTEKKIKNFSVNYYTGEINKLQESHKKEIESLLMEQQLKKEELKHMLNKQGNEIQVAVKLKKELNSLQMQIENERKESFSKLEKLETELQGLKTNLEGNVEEIKSLKIKLESTRKKAISYKNALKKAQQIIPEKYETLMKQIKNRNEAISIKENVIEQNLVAIEKELDLLYNK